VNHREKNGEKRSWRGGKKNPCEKAGGGENSLRGEAYQENQKRGGHGLGKSSKKQEEWAKGVKKGTR